MSRHADPVQRSTLASSGVGPVAITVAAMDWKNYEGGVYAPDAFDGDLDTYWDGAGSTGRPA